MAEELERRGLWDDVRIFHHRTRAMKPRKAVYSLTDRAYIADAGPTDRTKVKRRVSRLTAVLLRTEEPDVPSS